MGNEFAILAAFRDFILYFLAQFGFLFFDKVYSLVELVLSDHAALVVLSACNVMTALAELSEIQEISTGGLIQRGDPG